MKEEVLMQMAKDQESGQLSLLLGLLLLGVSSLCSITFSLVVLHILIIHGKGFVNLCPESSLILDTVVRLVDVFEYGNR
jgi:hypothetical protein